MKGEGAKLSYKFYVISMCSVLFYVCKHPSLWFLFMYLLTLTLIGEDI